MFGLFYCNETLLAAAEQDRTLFFVRHLVKNWIWPTLTFFGVTGNILAIIVLTKRRMIMSSTNNYLMVLALVDIFYLLLTMTLNIVAHPCFKQRSFSQIITTMAKPIADWSSNTSVWLTVTFTIERWVAITYPLQSRRWCTVYRARRIIGGVLIAALIATLPSAFEMKLVRVINNRTNVYKITAEYTELLKSKIYQKIYFNFVTFAIVWIPLILLLIFNTILVYYVHRSKTTSQETIDGFKLRRHHRTAQNEQRKTTIMLIAVVIVFTVCQIPQAISLTLASYNHELASSNKVLIYNNFANSLVALNASINFIFPATSIVEHSASMHLKLPPISSNLLEKRISNNYESNCIQMRSPSNSSPKLEVLKRLSRTESLKRISKSLSHRSLNSDPICKQYYSNEYLKQSTPTEIRQQSSLQTNIDNGTDSIFYSFLSLDSMASNENHDVWIKRLDIQRSLSTPSNLNESVLWGEILDVQV
ncbi:unnamed protein product [Didymodactylos carnosus]|uniref:G-protein coupled receptors family 1 profile domain-containing protein n=1 Tax=Didymodactylos carnosus TaxID=1234261 RepID=A0A813WV26_9BILA|nr:unnamed protein product [Didymodactylos carnosus]CAF3647845.1 unnamed protein product [Didymodactylos carnosus]